MSLAPDASLDVLPIFIARADTRDVVAFTGTGFVLAGGLFVTCWHCVSTPSDADHRYAVGFRLSGEKAYRIRYLDEIAQDPSGADLATARVDLESRFGLRLARLDVEFGTDVWTFGYPLSESYRGPSDALRVKLHPRYLQGYVMRSFHYEHATHGRIPSYELDMPTPAGLSGAPVVRIPSREIIGVIYGTADVSQIEHEVSVDPATGERLPEIQRIISFGLAHYLTTLHELKGPATGNKPLKDSHLA